MPVLVSVQMYDQRLWDNGHLIGEWARGMATSLTLNTRAEAPINKRAAGTRGNLARGISSRSNRTGARQRRITMYSSAPYTDYVVFGTGTIRAKSKKGMKLPGHYVGKGVNSATSKWVGMSFDGRKRKKVVSGQPANDFFERGMNRTAVRHPSLRG
jgi:hypothetical protein